MTVAGRIADRHGSGCRVKNTLNEGDCDCTARESWAHGHEAILLLREIIDLGFANIPTPLRTRIRSCVDAAGRS